MVVIVVFEKVAQGTAFLGLKETRDGRNLSLTLFSQFVTTMTSSNIVPILRTAAYVGKEAQ